MLSLTAAGCSAGGQGVVGGVGEGGGGGGGAERISNAAAGKGWSAAMTDFTRKLLGADAGSWRCS